ncbi:hypothetical protein [Streptomyces sp. NPDC058412]|uniref:ATP-dependent DNA ligase n=1 Tax=Streptomyces sp. NPDC058412 TaxID=3346486 RepID=UPI00365F2B83
MLVWARPEGVLLQSRRGTDLTPAFPEIAEAAAVLGDTTVLDGEVVIYRSGRLAFAALQQRLHRTSRTVARLAAANPAHFVAFDLLARGGDLALAWPYRQRRAALAAVFRERDLAAPWALTPSTTDIRQARQWIREWLAVGVEGVVAKGMAQPYRPGVRGWCVDCTKW